MTVEPAYDVFDRVADRIALALEGHGRDLAGLSLAALAIVTGIGLYFSGAGVIGDSLAEVAAATFGVTRFAVPIALLLAAVMLIRGTRTVVVIDAESSEEEVAREIERRRVVTRRGLGVTSGWIAAVGLAHLLADPPTIERAGWMAYQHAGGALGAVIGGGLQGVVGTAAATVVLSTVALGALTLLTGVPLREIGGVLRSLVDGAPDAAGGALLRKRRDRSRPAAPPLYDYDENPEDPLGRPGRNRRAAAASSSASPSDAPASPGGDAGGPDSPRPSVPPQIRVATGTASTGTEQLEIQLNPVRPDSHWTLPKLSILGRSAVRRPDTAAIARRGETLEAALAEHGVVTRLSHTVVGPTVTRYELELGPAVKVNAVVNLQKDIAYAMASPDVRIIAPVPGKQAVGVEVPNEQRQIVALGDILCSPEAQQSRSPLCVAVGRDVEGDVVMVDLAKMPHVLIAGQTGAGKSSCINSIMTSVLMRATPDDVRLILIDPKRVELTQYNRVPHLLTKVVTDPKKAANALAWAVAEMERRYELLEECGFRDLTGYNAAVGAGDLVPRPGIDTEYQHLPLILIVVDELADLMLVAPRDVEESINRIAAKARAVGLHLVVATQRPSVNVITGVIKANIPARFAFSVASATDSKVIMNHGGAERLVGKGDMLFLDPSKASAERVQGCFVDELEVQKVVRVWRDQARDELHYVPEVVVDTNIAAAGLPGSTPTSGSGGGSDDDELLDRAMELVITSQEGSTSMLQRKLKVGFSRAGRLMDLLEERGVVGPSLGSKKREVLLTSADLADGSVAANDEDWGGSGMSVPAGSASSAADLWAPSTPDPSATVSDFTDVADRSARVADPDPSDGGHSLSWDELDGLDER
ncbi:MAG: DNA translocase FtsK 4TM domain-containing protein [Microthrixaceae bacterium]